MLCGQISTRHQVLWIMNFAEIIENYKIIEWVPFLTRKCNFKIKNHTKIKFELLSHKYNLNFSLKRMLSG